MAKGRYNIQDDYDVHETAPEQHGLINNRSRVIGFGIG